MVGASASLNWFTASTYCLLLRNCRPRRYAICGLLVAVAPTGVTTGCMDVCRADWTGRARMGAGGAVGLAAAEAFICGGTEMAPCLNGCPSRLQNLAPGRL